MESVLTPGPTAESGMCAGAVIVVDGNMRRAVVYSWTYMASLILTLKKGNVIQVASGPMWRTVWGVEASLLYTRKRLGFVFGKHFIPIELSNENKLLQ